MTQNKIRLADLSEEVTSAFTPIDSDLTNIASLSGTTGLLRKTAENTWSLDNSSYLTSETDPKRVVSLAFSGTSTKTLTLTLADSTTVSNTFTDISSSGGGGGIDTIDLVGSTPNLYGATISGNILTLQPADATNPGIITTGDQTFSGIKTFSELIITDLQTTELTATSIFTNLTTSNFIKPYSFSTLVIKGQYGHDTYSFTTRFSEGPLLSIDPFNLTINRSISFPDMDGTLVGTINSISADSTGNIDITSVPTLTTPRTINGVAFDGSANITVPSDIAPSTSGNVLTSNGTTWTSSPNTGMWTLLKVSGTDATTTGQTLTNITGLVTGTLLNSTLYEVEVVLYVSTSAVTTGCQYAILAGGSGTAAQVFMNISGTTTTNAATTVTQSASGTQVGTFLTTASASGIIIMKGFIFTRSAGTANISVQHLKVTSGTSTVRIGSVLRYRVA